MSQTQSYLRAKTFLTEDVLLPELLSDILVISESDKDDSVRERRIVHPKQSYNEGQISSDESDDSKIVTILQMLAVLSSLSVYRLLV
jgi:hypothetical protein